MSAQPPTIEDADYIARMLVLHLFRTVGQSLADHRPGRLDAEDFSRFLHGELREKVTAIEQRIADLLPPLHADEPTDDALLRAAAGRLSVRGYMRKAARDGEYVRTTAGLRRVVE